MDITMDIAAMSVNLSMARAGEDFGTAVMKMAMDSQTEALGNMLEMIDVSSMTGIGGNLDVLV